MAEEIIIRAKLDSSGATSGLESVNKELNDLEQNAKKTSASVTKSLGSVRNSAQGVVGAFVAVSSSVAILGGNTENYAKTLTRLIAVQNIANGLLNASNMFVGENNILTTAQSAGKKILTVVEKAYSAAVGSTTGAMKLLRIAMLALPIFAIIAGITLLVTWLYKLATSSKEADEQFASLTTTHEAFLKSMQRGEAILKAENDHILRMAELEGKSLEEMFTLKANLLKKEYDAREYAIKEEVIQMQKLERLRRYYAGRGMDDKANEVKDELEKSRENYDKLTQQQEQYGKDITYLSAKNSRDISDREDKFRQDQLQRQKEANERKLKEEEATRQKLLELERYFEDLLISNIKDDQERRETELLTRYQREQDLLIEKYGEDTELLKELETKRNNELQALQDEFKEKQREKDLAEKAEIDEIDFRDRQAELEARLLQIQDDFEAEQEVRQMLAELERDQALKNDKLTTGERLLIQEQYNAKLLAMAKRRSEQEKQIQQAAANAAKNIVSGLTNAIMDNAEEGSKAYKAAAITQTTIETIQGALTAVTQSIAQLGPIAGGIVGGILAAGITASGIAAIKKIQSTSTSVRGGSSSMPSAPDIGNITHAGSIASGVTESGNVMENSKTEGQTQVVILQSEIEQSQQTSDKVNVLSKG